jgi:hypothetical protein
VGQKNKGSVGGMRTSNLLPEECKKEIKERLFELEAEKKITNNPNFEGCIELLNWVLK